MTETPHQPIDNDIENHQFEAINLENIDYVYFEIDGSDMGKMIEDYHYYNGND
tara:strand:- start:481 stop:639 length:159 start_codon:yes stop_codon:yes gene_type:complete